MNINTKDFDDIKPFDSLTNWAKVSGFSYWMLRDLCLKGKIPYMRSGKTKILINKSGFLAYLEKQMQENASNV